MRETKLEKQYKQIQKRGIKISKNEFITYFNLLRKANRKGQRLKRQPEVVTLRSIEYSTERLPTSREEFLKYRRSINAVLKRDWRKRANEKQRERTNKNLRELYGKDATKIIRRLNKMTDKQYEEFFKNNKDLTTIRWGSPDDAVQVKKLLDLTANKFMERLYE